MGIRTTGKATTIKLATDGIEDTFRKLIIAADAAIVNGTPVDTGRARANWFTDFGSFRPRTTDSLSVTSSRAASWTINDGNVFIHNSVEYIVYLDEGSSAQAPQGILDPAIAAVRGRFF